MVASADHRDQINSNSEVAGGGGANEALSESAPVLGRSH